MKKVGRHNEKQWYYRYFTEKAGDLTDPGLKEVNCGKLQRQIKLCNKIKLTVLKPGSDTV